MNENVAKKARVGETAPMESPKASASSSIMGSTSDGVSSIASSERSEGDFLVRVDKTNDDEEHNYSITNRWRKRHERWGNFKEQVCADGFDLKSLRLLTGEQLFLTIDDSSLLGEELVAFAAKIQELKDRSQTLEEETAQLCREIELLKMQRNALAAEVETLDEHSPSQLQLDTVLVERLIEMNTKLIKEKTERIKEKTELIVEKSKRIKMNNEVIEKNTEEVRSATKEVDAVIKEISLKHREIRNKFSFVKAKGNETVLTITSQLQSLDLTRFDANKTSSPSDCDMLRPETNPHFRDKLIQLVGQDEKTTLASFQKFVVELFEAATKTDDSNLVKHTTDAILGWEDGTELNKAVEYARPPTDHDKETTADQPILHAVICRIIGIIANINENSDDVLHQREHGLTTEQCVAGSSAHNEKTRRIDVTAHPHEEYLGLMLPAMVKKPIEIKIAPDATGKFKKAVEKGRSQTVSHIGKRLAKAFDLAGAGKDARVVGICLTPLSIEVIQMSLSGVGTAEVALEIIGTGCVPLLGTKWLTPDQKVEFESTETNGFVLLAGALKHETCDEFDHVECASFKQVDPIEEDLTDIVYLGSGAFANVVQLNKQGEFMKIPKSAAQAKSLIEEAAILEKLQCGDGSSSIPRLIFDTNGGVCSIQTVIRGEISNMQGLRLSGVVGVPLNGLPRHVWQKYAKSIIATVYEALKFAHNKLIYHLDVRPGNIIVSFIEGVDRCCAMLSDWGCSVHGDAGSLKKFRGCTPYAHDRLLGKNFRGQLGSDLDFASLAYTIVHVSTGRLRWAFEFDRPSNVSPCDLEKRRTFVSEWLENEDVLSEEIQVALRTACCPRRAKRTRTTPDRFDP